MRENKHTKNILNFLRSHPLISITGLEKAGKVPNDTIRKWIYGFRSLPKKHIYKIELVLKLGNYILINPNKVLKLLI